MRPMMSAESNPSKKYSIGKKLLHEPLVTTAALKAHLSFLRALKDLRSVVDDGTDSRLPEISRSLNRTQRWTWFVHLAVERFHTWLLAHPSQTLSFTQWIQTEIPPVDVLMVWHAYMLNPMWFAEDCNRLRKLAAPLKTSYYLLEALINLGDTILYEPSERCKATWVRRCGTPYDPLASASENIEHTVVCPSCLNKNTAPFLSSTGTGYAEEHFKLSCESCRFVITRENLAVLKFAHDMALDSSSTRNVAEHGNQVYLAGTLHSARASTNDAWAHWVKQSLYTNRFLMLQTSTSKTAWVKSFCNRTSFSMSKIIRTMNTSSNIPRATVNRIISAYYDDRPFSVELVGAVTRQCSFIDKMNDIGWTKPGCFDEKEDEIVLVHAIARYHAFLDLMSVNVNGFFVPTLDIDLAWHTHQMMSNIYFQDCRTHIGRYVDHDDTVTSNVLAPSFDSTCQVWERRFHIPYSYCGCPLPGSSIGKRLSFLKMRLGLGDSPPSEALIPPERDDAMLATHASDHNCIFASAPREATFLAQRVTEIGQRRQRDLRRMKSGKLSEDVVARGQKHDAAFLCPVPFKTWTPAADCLSVSDAYRANRPADPVQQNGQAGRRATQRTKAFHRGARGQHAGPVSGAPFSNATAIGIGISSCGNGPSSGPNCTCGGGGSSGGMGGCGGGGNAGASSGCGGGASSGCGGGGGC